MREIGEEGLRKAYAEPLKQARHDKVAAAKKHVIDTLKAAELKPELAAGPLKHLEADIVRGAIADGLRVR